jgi:hypothetical protein
MSPSEKFLRFAAECESMAKFTHSRENKLVWSRMAERWVRCAELAKGQAATQISSRRHRKPAHHWSH